MPTKIIEINSAQGLLAGLFPSLEKTVGPVWRDGSNVLFRDLGLEQGLGNDTFKTGLGRSPKALAQAYAGEEARLYYEDNGYVFSWNGSISNVIGQLDTAGDYVLEPYGNWLLATDGIGALKLWKNADTFIDVGGSQFSKARIVKKFQGFAVAYGTDVLPNGYHWSGFDTPDIWDQTLANRAGMQAIIEFDSEVKTVCQLGQNHAVYSEDSMALVSWVGGQNVFGYRIALNDIGGLSKRSVIERGRKNYGLNMAGIFITDGVQFEFVDRPAMNTWLRDNVDWSLKEQIFGYSDERLGLLIWSVPVVGGGSTRIAFHPESKAFTKLSGTFTAGIQKQVLQYPIIASSSGLQYASIETESAPECSLVSNPMDAGAPNMYKQWDYLLFAGTFGGLEVRIGYSDTEEGAVEWTAWKQVAREVPFTPRESIFLTIELRSIAGAAKWRISGITVFGEPAGFTV